MKKLFLLLVLGLVLVSGCNIPGSLIHGLRRCNYVLDCGKDQYCEAGKFRCKDIINECETDNDCSGDETCEIREISTSWACNIDKECPRVYHNVCELTEEIRLAKERYCEKDDDCVWAFNPNSCCDCPQIYNRKIVETNNGLVIYEKGKDYGTIDCGDIVCSPCAPITELECVNNKCKKVF